MAGYLFFKAPSVPLILDGIKVQTLRKNLAGTVITSDIVHAMCDHSRPPFARLHVVSIDRVHIDDLTRADARREGLRSLPHLLDALDALYPDADHLMRLRFRLA